MIDYDNIGQQLRERMNELHMAVAEAKQRRDDFMDAWDKQDWAWLADAGFITHAQAKELSR